MQRASTKAVTNEKNSTKAFPASYQSKAPQSVCACTPNIWSNSHSRGVQSFLQSCLRESSSPINSIHIQIQALKIFTKNPNDISHFPYLYPCCQIFQQKSTQTSHVIRNLIRIYIHAVENSSKDVHKKTAVSVFTSACMLQRIPARSHTNK